MAHTDSEDMFSKSMKRNWLEFHVAMDYMKHGLQSFVSKQVKQMHKSLNKKVNFGERCTICTSDHIIWNRSKNNWSFSSPCPSNLCDTWLKEILNLHKNPKSKCISLQNCDVTAWPSEAWEVAKVFMPKGQPPLKKDFNQCGVNDLLSLLANCRYFTKYVSKDCLNLIEKVSDERNAICRSGLIELAEDKRKKLSGFIIQILEDPVTFRSMKSCQKAVENIRKKQRILELDPLMGTALEALFEDKIQHVEVERGLKTLKTQSSLNESKVSEHGTNVQDYDSHTQDRDALPKDKQTHLADDATLIQEGGSSAQYYSIHPQNQDVPLKVQEKLEDYRTSDWRKEIKEICSDTFCRKKLEMYLSEKRNDMALENILQHILKKKDKEALDILLTTISKEWRINHGDQRIVVWLGLDHREKRKGNEIFVCFHSADIVSKFSKFLGLPIIYRRLDETEMEPLENRLNDKYQKVSLKKEDAANIKCLINELGECLFQSHRNLEAILASSVKSRKIGILQQTSIVLYCRLKHVIPFGEDFFPKELKIKDQIYPTDIREGFFSFGMIPGQNQSITLPQVFNQTLRMGCSIGSSVALLAGTLGPFVRNKANNIGFLTCAHVLGLNTPVGTPVCQPALNDPGPVVDTRICGTCVKGEFDFSSKPGVDAALVLVDQSKREVDSAGFIWIDRQQLREAGFSDDDLPTYEDGGVIAHADYDQAVDKRVIKVGRSSGLTQGIFAMDGAMLKIDDALLALPFGTPCPPHFSGNIYLMQSQFIINSVGNNSFFSLGDSGSGVYLVERKGMEKKLVLIGIAIGALSPSECVVTPIGTVLKALELDESCIITECVMQH